MPNVFTVIKASSGVEYNLASCFASTPSSSPPTTPISISRIVRAARDFSITSRYNQRMIDEFDNNTNTLTIYNVTLDYGTEGASPNNFEVLVFGLHIPGNYTIKEVGNNVVITLNEQYIDYDNVTINDIYVMGKLVDVPVATEDDSIIITESGLDIII
jgi:hypothetical protein